MELRTYLREVLRFFFIIIFVVVASSAIAYVATSAMTETYTAESRLVVTAGLGTNGERTDDVLAAPRVGQTYAVIATTRPLLLDVIKRAGLPYDPEELVTRLSVTADLDRPFLTVSMNDTNRNRAAAAANALAEALVEEASVTSTDGTPGASLLAIVERAAIPTDPTGPRIIFNTVLAGAAGLILALVLVALVAYLRESERPSPGTGIG